MVASWDPHTHPVITEAAGTLKYVDIQEQVMVEKEVDSVTGISSLVVLDPKQRPAAGKDVRPMVKLVDRKAGSEHCRYRYPGALFSAAGLVSFCRWRRGAGG